MCVFWQDTVEVFLSREGLKDEADTDGRSAFMWACSKGADDVIRCFIRHQVDMQQTDKNGGTGGFKAGGHLVLLLLTLQVSCTDGIDMADVDQYL